ncbi:MAG: hypothetical protein R3E41_08640 [Burkholderiaceae bacterium]
MLAPSALLGWRWAFAQRPVARIGVALAMEAIAQLIVLLLLVRNARDCACAFNRAVRRGAR